MAKKDTVRAARLQAQSLADRMGYELVDVELAMEHGASFLRIFVDLPGGMSLEGCERFHRAVLPLVKELEYDYLEVSSPGADRPLRTERDFHKAKGKAVEVRLYTPMDGKKQYLGALAGLEDGLVRIECPDGTHTFPKAACALIRPLLEQWSEEEHP